MKAPDINKVARRIDGTSWGNSKYECKFCKQQIPSHYGDLKATRSHMLRKHRIEYYSSVLYIINEESDLAWTPAK